MNSKNVATTGEIGRRGSNALPIEDRPRSTPQGSVFIPFGDVNLGIDRKGNFSEGWRVNRTALWLFCGMILAGTGLGAAEVQASAKLNPVAPSPALVAAAKANGISLEGIDPANETDRIDPGDSLSALITLFEKGGKQSQWLVHLEAVAPNAEERAQKVAPPMVLYSSFGGTQSCVSVPAFAVVRTFGPFINSAKGAKGGKAPMKSARFTLNKGYLGLGLHDAAAAFKALAEGPVRGTWMVRHKPFSEAEVAKGREMAAKAQLTEAQEQALVGSIPALLSYFEAVQNTPGLSDILFDVLDLPSAWSLLRNGGIKSVGFGFGKGVVNGKPTSWSLPEAAPVYHLPVNLDLNDHRALNLKLIVTSPNPPLLACAGVVGLLAEKPDDPHKYLTLRVLSARAGAVKKSPP